jgi:hypothetical protein
MRARRPKHQGRRLVSETEQPDGSAKLPDPSGWILLSKAPRTHVFGKTNARKVPPAPGCYEIGVSEPDKEPRPDWIVYVGVAGIGEKHNLKGRFYNHASGHGANTVKPMDRFLKRGYWIWARYYKTSDSEEARVLEKRLLKDGWWHYHWNKNEIPPALIA